MDLGRIRPGIIEHAINTALADDTQTDFILVGKFGQNTELAADVEEDIWSAGGIKNIITTAETISIVSSSTADDLGSTGAQLIRLYGLDANYDLQQEDVTLDGTTPVVTTTTWREVSRISVIYAGTGLTNAGTITVTNTSSAQTMAVIQAGFGITQDSHYTVPNGYSGFLISMEAAVYRSSGSGSREAEIYGKFFNHAGNMKLTLGTVAVENGTVYRKFDVPARVPEKSIYWYSAIASGNNTACSVRWNMVLIKNTLLTIA